MPVNANQGGPLQPGDHYVLRKVSNQLLPWIICGRRLRSLWIVRLASFYGYIGDLAAALAGLGIGAPIAALISSGKAEPGKSALDVMREVLPPAWFVVGVIALVVWLALRLFIQKEDVIARALLARDCAHSMRALNQQLWIALADPNPMPAVTNIQKSVDDQVQNAIRNKVWPWDPLPPSEEIASELTAATDELRRRFMNTWSPPPPGAI
jgi:hypothetical protein